MDFATLGSFNIVSTDLGLEAEIGGTFNLEGVQQYIDALQEQILQKNYKDWVLIVNVDKLEVSTMEAMDKVSDFAPWLLEHHCIALIHVSNQFNSLKIYQLERAFTGNKTYSSNDMASARQLAKQLVSQAA